jgi:hypothetical protein
MKLSIILPAYNEEKNIGKAIEDTKKKLEEFGIDYEIIVAEDGSEDRTYEIAMSYSQRDERIRVLHYPERLGRGEALKRAFKTARGEILLYMDVDLATDLSHISDVIKLMEEGYDIVVGSRKTSLAKRSLPRRFLSWCYNFWVRMLLKSKIKDHQCGFKAFRKESTIILLDEVKDNGWFWDTEILVRAQYRELKIAEIPVIWREKGDTKVKFFRDSIEMGLSALLLKLELVKLEGRWGVGSVLIALLILASITFFSGFENIFKSLLSVSFLALSVASIIYSLSWVLRGIRYSAIIGKIGYKLSILTSISLIFLSQSLNIVLPGRIGDLSRVYILRRDSEIPVLSALSSLLLERVFDLLSVATLGLLSFVILGVELYEKSSLVFLISILLTLLFVLSVFLIRFSTSSRISSYLQKIFGDMRKLFELKSLTLFTSLSMLLWMIEAVVSYVILSSFIHASLLLVILAVSFANLTKVFPITPGGIGTYEAAMTGVLTAGGIPTEISFTVALVDHALKNLVTLIFGFLSLRTLDISLDVLKRGVRNIDSK